MRATDHGAVAIDRFNVHIGGESGIRESCFETCSGQRGCRLVCVDVTTLVSLVEVPIGDFGSTIPADVYHGRCRVVFVASYGLRVHIWRSSGLANEVEFVGAIGLQPTEN